MSIPPIPEGFGTITPHLTIKNAQAAIDFYARAFGAEIVERHTSPDGQGVMHATLRIGDSVLMLNDEFPDWGALGPDSIGGSAVTVHLYVEDVDRLFQQALDAGAEAEMPVQDVFWGDRYGMFVDPSGLGWVVATHREDVTSEEMIPSQ